MTTWINEPWFFSIGNLEVFAKLFTKHNIEGGLFPFWSSFSPTTNSQKRTITELTVLILLLGYCSSEEVVFLFLAYPFLFSSLFIYFLMYVKCQWAKKSWVSTTSSSFDILAFGQPLLFFSFRKCWRSWWRVSQI